MALIDFLEQIFNKTDDQLRTQNVPDNPGDGAITETATVSVGQDVSNQHIDPGVSNQDTTTRKANGDGGSNKPTVYYYPQEIENPSTLSHVGTPKNIIKIDVKDFSGGTLETEMLKYQKLTTLNDTASEVDIRKVLSDPVDPINDRVTGSTLYQLNKDVLRLSASAWTGNGPTTEINIARQQQVSQIFEKLLQPAPVEPDLLRASLYLYAPDNVQANYDFAYKEEDLSPTYRAADLLKVLGGTDQDKNKAVDVLKQAGVNFISSLTKNIPLTETGLGGAIDIDAALRAKTRTIPVQNFEYLFERVNRRSFHYHFKLYPKSKKEIQQILGILTTLKYYSHPAQSNNTRYFKAPSVFQIGFYTMHKDRWVENLYINKIKPCALEHISINYTDSGKFATLKDLQEAGDTVLKSPVGIAVELKFHELQILTRDDMAEPGESLNHLADKNKRFY